MEILTKKGKNIAKTAEKNIPKQKPSEDVSKERKQKATVKPVLFNLAEFDKEKIEQAEALGIPIRKIADTMNAYAQSVEDRFEIIVKAIPTNEQVKNAMSQAIVEAQNRAYEKAVKEGSLQGGGGGQSLGLGDLLKIVSGGGGQDSELLDLQKEMYKMNIDSIKHRADLSDQIVAAVISKIAAKGVKEIV